MSVNEEHPFVDNGNGHCACPDCTNARAEASSEATIRACPLLTRLSRHIAQMAPHQRERQAGKLLIEARDALVIEQKSAISIAAACLNAGCKGDGNSTTSAVRELAQKHQANNRLIATFLYIIGQARACRCCRTSAEHVQFNRVRYGIHKYADYDGREWLCDEHHTAGENFYETYEGEDPDMRLLVNSLGPDAFVFLVRP